MKSGTILVVFILLSATAYSATIWVPDDYPTIQGAIDASSSGDTVIVRPGTYVENIDFVGKAITVKSEQGARVTTIDGNQAGSVAVFQSGEGLDSRLTGFSLTNGSGRLDSSGDVSGGGIYCESSSPTITDNSITANIVVDHGGGMFISSGNPTVIRCTFNENSATYGGGMYTIDGAPLIVQCRFHKNFASSRGGGIRTVVSGSKLIDCMFTYNVTDHKGGGMENSSSNIEVINCTFIGNDAAFAGGGIYSYLSDFEAINCTLSRNDSSWGGGLFNHTCSPTATNCIVWGNRPEEIADYNYSYPVVTYSCIQGGYSGTGNIDADPLFADLANGDCHLTWSSPCRGAGDNSAITELYDFEGDPRIALGTVDMGADEYYYRLYHMGDVVPGSPIDIKVVGYPTAPVTLYLGSGLADPPYSTEHGDFFLNWPPLWQGSIGTVPEEGIKVLSTTVPSGWTPGSEHPLQALVGPWGGTYTLLTNPLILTVE